MSFDPAKLHESQSEVVPSGKPRMEGFPHSNSTGTPRTPLMRKKETMLTEEPFFSSTSSIPWSGGLVATGSIRAIDKVGRETEVDSEDKEEPVEAQKVGN